MKEVKLYCLFTIWVDHWTNGSQLYNGKGCGTPRSLSDKCFNFINIQNTAVATRTTSFTL